MKRLLQKVRTAWDILSRFGGHAFIEAVRERSGWHQDRVAPSTNHRDQLDSWTPGDNPAFGVSVVIPTRDGGEDLRRLVEVLLAQEGCDVEVVLVDSQSSDGSVDAWAADSRVKVLSISPRQFTHSFSRNQGIAASRHPLVFLTVQDASIPDRGWLGRLCSLRAWERLDALTVKETPREDADPYARFSIEAFSGGRASGTTVYQRGRGTRHEILVAASLNNVACLYRREVLRPGFEGEFGEDFRTGLRLHRDGFRTGFTDEVVIGHSHNRAASYWLKRTYASSVLQRNQGLGDRQTFESSEAGSVLCRTALFVWRRWRRGQDAASELTREFDLFQALPYLFSPEAQELGGRRDGAVARDLTLSIRDLERWLDRHQVHDPKERQDTVWKHLMSRLGWLLGGVRIAPWQEQLAAGV